MVCIYIFRISINIYKLFSFFWPLHGIWNSKPRDRIPTTVARSNARPFNSPCWAKAKDGTRILVLQRHCQSCCTRSGMPEVAILCKLIVEETSHHFCCILLGGSKSPGQPTFKGRGLLRCMNTRWQSLLGPF